MVLELALQALVLVLALWQVKKPRDTVACIRDLLVPRSQHQASLDLQGPVQSCHTAQAQQTHLILPVMDRTSVETLLLALAAQA